MAEKKRKSGDVVVSKSGGPDMTVQHYTTYGTVFCIWFVGSEKHDGTFNPDSLESAED